MNQSPKEIPIKKTDGAPYDVPVEGSMGLLALGFQGLKVWRAKRKEMNYNFSEHLFIPKPLKKK
ncbi:MAG: hypothetical protein AB8B69_07225 [Chitinophagales bacterium]